MKTIATPILCAALAATGVSPLCAQRQMTMTQSFDFQENRTIKGAPYSATAISTSTQTLGDGTHITRSTETQLARDSEGRTRREQTVNAVGPWTANGKEHLIYLNDPVSQVRYVLYPDRQTAVKNSAPGDRQTQESIARLKRVVEQATRARVEASVPNSESRDKDLARVKAAMAGIAVADGPLTMSSGGSAYTLVLGDGGKGTSKIEDLGDRVIEGVKAKGRRESYTLAVGEIGNDRPIEISSEIWFSDELQTVVYSKRSDPRVGESEYRLINVSRAEPSPAVFELPGGYTVKEEPRRRE